MRFSSANALVMAMNSRIVQQVCFVIQRNMLCQSESVKPMTFLHTLILSQEMNAIHTNGFRTNAALDGEGKKPLKRPIFDVAP